VRNFRAPAATSTLDAANDYEAVQAWLSLHEAAATQRAYRKEAERLILWGGIVHAPLIDRGPAGFAHVLARHLGACPVFRN